VPIAGADAASRDRVSGSSSGFADACRDRWPLYQSISRAAARDRALPPLTDNGHAPLPNLALANRSVSAQDARAAPLRRHYASIGKDPLPPEGV
jgi:hypothetical protein